MEQTMTKQETVRNNAVPSAKAALKPACSPFANIAGNQAALKAVTPSKIPVAKQSGGAVIQRRAINASDINSLVKKQAPDFNISPFDIKRIVDLTLSLCPDCTSFFSVPKKMIETAKAIIATYARFLKLVPQIPQDNIMNMVEAFMRKDMATAIPEETAALANSLLGEQGITTPTFWEGPKKHTLLELMEALDPESRSSVLDNIKRLLRLSNQAGVSAVLEGANMNVSLAFLYNFTYNTTSNPSKEKQERAFAQRVQLMTEMIEGVGNSDIDTPQGTMKLRDVYLIESTGSDPHKGGRHPLFLINKKTNERRVYKPRSLKTDQALTGRTGVIKELTTNEENPLPLMSFFEEEQAGKEEALRPPMEQMILRTGASQSEYVTWEKAVEFFRQTGELNIIATLSSVTDLHTDNIIFTSNGPIIVDAECAFADSSGSYLESDGGPFMRSYNSSSTGNATSLFYLMAADGKIYNSVEAYRAFPDLKTAYQNGKTEALKKLMAHKDQKKESFQNIAKEASYIRIVPISTQAFSEILEDFWINENEPFKLILVEALTIQIMQDMLNKKWIFTGNADLVFVSNAFSQIIQILKQAFEALTIPALYIVKSDQMTWIIQLDDTEILRVFWQKPIETAMGERFAAQLDLLFNETFHAVPKKQSPLRSPVSSAASPKGAAANLPRETPPPRPAPSKLATQRIKYRTDFKGLIKKHIPTVVHVHFTDSIINPLAEKLMNDLHLDKPLEDQELEKLITKSLPEQENYAAALQVECHFALRLCAEAAEKKEILEPASVIQMFSKNIKIFELCWKPGDMEDAYQAVKTILSL